MQKKVSDLLRTGGAVVYTTPEASVSSAAAKMARHNIGSVLVMERNRDLVGIFTERDLLTRVVVPARDPKTTTIREVMSPDVILVAADTPVVEVLKIMNDCHCRHIPVAVGERLLGVISLRDILRYENETKDFQIEQLHEYIFQKPYPSFSV
jgi:CBS domain-containing protein